MRKLTRKKNAGWSFGLRVSFLKLDKFLEILYGFWDRLVDKAEREREREICSQPLRGRSFRFGKFEMVPGSGVFCVSNLRSFKFLKKI